jgi:hypothetical protein
MSHQEEPRYGSVSESEASREQRNDADPRHQARTNSRFEAPTSASIPHFRKFSATAISPGRKSSTALFMGVN